MNNPQVMANLPYIFESTGYYSSPPSDSAQWTPVQTPFYSASPAPGSYLSASYADGGYTPSGPFSNYACGGSQEVSGLQRARAAHGIVGTEGLVGRARAAKYRSRGYGKDRSGSGGFYTPFG
jgi:hypothetical protein